MLLQPLLPNRPIDNSTDCNFIARLLFKDSFTAHDLILHDTVYWPILTHISSSPLCTSIDLF